MAVAAMIVTSALWALTFIAPLLLPELSSLAVAGLRYGVFGGGALLLWCAHERRSADRVRRGSSRGATRTRSPDGRRQPHPIEGTGIDWGRATLHALTGNIGHYVLAVLAVRIAGAPVTVSVIALVPIAYGLLGAREEAREAAHNGGRATVWRALAGPLTLTALGIVAVDVATLRGADPPSLGALTAGVLLAAASGAAWLWYGLDTARHLRATGISAGRWTNAVGVATAPLAVPLLVIGFATSSPAGGIPIVPTAVVALVLGVGSSWVGTAGFNYASARLPRHLLAPLMALEPAWTLVLAHVVDGRFPGPLQLTGETLLVAGAAVALRSLRSGGATPEANGRDSRTSRGRDGGRDRGSTARREQDPARAAA